MLSTRDLVQERPGAWGPETPQHPYAQGSHRGHRVTGTGSSTQRALSGVKAALRCSRCRGWEKAADLEVRLEGLKAPGGQGYSPALRGPTPDPCRPQLRSSRHAGRGGHGEGWLPPSPERQLGPARASSCTRVPAATELVPPSLPPLWEAAPPGISLLAAHTALTSSLGTALLRPGHGKEARTQEVSWGLSTSLHQLHLTVKALPSGDQRESQTLTQGSRSPGGSYCGELPPAVAQSPTSPCWGLGTRAGGQGCVVHSQKRLGTQGLWLSGTVARTKVFPRACARSGATQHTSDNQDTNRRRPRTLTRDSGNGPGPVQVTRHGVEGVLKKQGKKSLIKHEFHGKLTL